MAIEDFIKHVKEANEKRVNPLMAKKKAPNPLLAKMHKAAAAKPKAEAPAEKKPVSPLARLKNETITVEPKAPQKKAPKVESVLVTEEETVRKTEVDDIESPVPTSVAEDEEDAVVVEPKAEPAKKEAAAEKETVKPVIRRKRRTHAEVLADKAAKEEEKAKKKQEADKKADEEALKEAEAEAKTKAPAKKAAAKKEEKATVVVSDFRPIDIFNQEVSPEEAAGLLNSQYESDDFHKFEEEVIERLQSIQITPDMNPGTLKYALSDLDALNSEIMIHLIEARKVINAWTDKEYGPITAYRIEHSTGKNAQDRRRNAFAALANANVQGHQVNMLALVTSAKMQLEFFQGIADTIKSKQQMLITMNGALKMENSSMAMGA